MYFKCWSGKVLKKGVKANETAKMIRNLPKDPDFSKTQLNTILKKSKIKVVKKFVTELYGLYLFTFLLIKK
jgi:hypothetical protein